MFGRRPTDVPPLRLVRDATAEMESIVQAAGRAAAALSSAEWLAQTKDRLIALMRERLSPEAANGMKRGDVAARATELVREIGAEDGVEIDPVDERNLVSVLVNSLALRRPGAESSGGDARTEPGAARNPINAAKVLVQPKLLARLDLGAALALPREELERQIGTLVAEILSEEKQQLNAPEQRDLVTKLLNDMLGLGPLEPLLDDESITDIMVNGAKQVYVERGGKLELTGVTFRDDAHVMNVASRIVSRVGRRVDESNPLCDARLMDGSRVNIVIPPLAIDGPSISIRKFAKKKITIEIMTRNGNLSPALATVLKIAGRARLNILISGGTGSGKNALSQMIDPGERIVTIEDAAELQLQQPHVVRLETRPANIEGGGEVNMRDLVKNALRMRPDRIILGEVRGPEAMDMLQAMNTGHEGSLGTLHANRPREALMRLENMVGMVGVNLPSKAVRTQIAAALDMIVQVTRMRDGIRRVTQVVEVVGMEGDVITTQDLFNFEVEGEGPDGRLLGKYRYSGLRPHFAPKAAYFGLETALFEALG
jgi:pilus assembly protein CpaF